MKCTYPAKKPASQDWHNADVKAALEKRGFSLARLSRLKGYCRGAAQNVLHRPWPKMEAIVAAAIGVPAQTIWPSRYDENGHPNRARGRPRTQPARAPQPQPRAKTKSRTKDSTARKAGNVQELGGE